jgi:hypothetical protein
MPKDRIVPGGYRIGSVEIAEQLVVAGWHGVSGEAITRPEAVNEWCRRNISWDEWDCVGYDYWFRREQDAVLFILRWGG